MRIQMYVRFDPSGNRALAEVLACSAVLLVVVILFALRTSPPTAPRTAPGEGYYVKRIPVRLPAVNPESVGMSASRLDEITDLVSRGIKAGGFPGAAVVIGRQGGEVLAKGFGHLDWSAKSPAVDPDSTVYDLASLTKVVATTSAIMALYDDGIISLNDPVSKWIPEFSGGLKDQVTIRELLTHHSGLPPGRAIWHLMGDSAAARAAVISTPLVKGCPPGSCYMYSDLGADMLGFIVEAASHESLAEFTESRIFEPLGMTQTTFHPTGVLLEHLAPTGAPRGRVHDSNAAALGGDAGHAGLFSTASDLAVFAQMLLNGGEYDGVRIFAPATVELFTKRAKGTRALGWDTCDSANVRSTCGRYLSSRAFGHTGFTGTSLWVDPDRKMFVLILTNRVDSPRIQRPEIVIHDIRADVADAAVLAVADTGSRAEISQPVFRSDNEQRWREPESTRRSKSRRGHPQHRRVHSRKVPRRVPPARRRVSAQ